MAKKSITVSQSKNKDQEVPYEVLAESIVKISRFAEEIKKSRLNEKAILTLMKDFTGIPKDTIKRVLDGLSVLEAVYTKK